MLHFFAINQSRRDAEMKKFVFQDQANHCKGRFRVIKQLVDVDRSRLARVCDTRQRSFCDEVDLNLLIDIGKQFSVNLSE